MLAFSGIPDLQMEMGRQGGCLGLFNMLCGRNVLRKIRTLELACPGLNFSCKFWANNCVFLCICFSFLIYKMKLMLEALNRNVQKFSQEHSEGKVN